VRRLPGLRILVVDGSEINCEVVRRILEAEGASVEVEDSGQDALGLLDTCPKIDAGLRESEGLRSCSIAIALYARRQSSKINLCCGGQYAPASHRSQFEPTLKHGPIVAKNRPFSAQKKAVTASASIMPRGRLLIPFAGTQNQKSTHCPTVCEYRSFSGLWV
jgi:hypothetical protein